MPKPTKPPKELGTEDIEFVGTYIRHKDCGTVTRSTERGEWCPKCKQWVKDDEIENIEIK